MFSLEVDFDDDQPWSDRFKTAQTYRRLKELLLFQKIPPRTKLDIGVLAGRLNVSKTPVREALIMLAEERIIQVLPGSGYFSKPLRAAEIAEEYEVAFAMLKHIIEAHIDEFPKAGFVGQIRETVFDVRSTVIFIETIFESIAAMSGNGLSLKMIRSFIDRTTFIRELDLQQPGRLNRVADAISEFISCLAYANARGAVQILQRQFNEKVNLLQDLIAAANRHAADATDRWEETLR